jgi:hypothetical protein
MEEYADLCRASHDPAAASSIVAAIGTLLEITPYKAAGDAGIESLRDIVEVLGRNGWVERVVEIMKDFIATNVSVIPERGSASSKATFSDRASLVMASIGLLGGTAEDTRHPKRRILP